MQWKTTFSNIFAVVTVMCLFLVATYIMFSIQFGAAVDHHMLKDGAAGKWFAFWCFIWAASFVGHAYQSFSNNEWFKITITPEHSQWWNDAGKTEVEFREFTETY